LKPVVNSTSTRYAQFTSAVSAERVARWTPRLPGYVWLAMIMVAAAALAVGTMARTRGEMREARTAYAEAQASVARAEGANHLRRAKLRSLQENPQAIERQAEERLHYVRPNEIIVGTR
jgi:hypothetical protein